MILLEDTRNKQGKHDLKRQFWEENGIEVVRQVLPVGDYVLMNDKIKALFDRTSKRGATTIPRDNFFGKYSICVDSKQNIQELLKNVCSDEHGRFREECIKAQDNGIKLIVLVENKDGIECTRDLHRWVNPQLFIRKNGRQVHPNAVRGVTLMKSCLTMEKKYGVEFRFCNPALAGSYILRILGGGENE